MTLFILKLTKPAYITTPKGELTSDPSDILIRPEGEEVFCNEKTKAAYELAGITFTVEAQCDQADFVAECKRQAAFKRIVS